MQVIQIPCLEDNYGYLLHEERSGVTIAIDSPDADAILNALNSHGWSLTHLLNTHHHWDHTGGNTRLKAATGCQIIGPEGEADRIPEIDRTVSDGEVLDIGNQRVEVIETPGHTLGHVVYYFPQIGAAFVGDTLFSMGCGRLFEGTARQMWHSLQKIMAWPDDTQLYCAHEYTQANARFAMRIEPENPDLIRYAREVDEKRERGESTIPTNLGLECKINPFLRANTPPIRHNLKMENASASDVFAEIRQRKDQF